jgi:hypothetical protein
LGMKILQNKITWTQIIFSSSTLSFILFFLFHECFHYYYMYIFNSQTCTIIIITLEPCALKVEFQHFILKFNIRKLFLANTIERGDKGWKKAQKHSENRVTLWIDLICDFFLVTKTSCTTNFLWGLLVENYWLFLWSYNLA